MTEQQVYLNMNGRVSSGDYLTAVNMSYDDTDENCALCTKQGLKHTATSYCKQCKFYMCFSCYTVHLLPEPQRNHQLVDLREQPEQCKELTEELLEIKHASTEIYTQYRNALEKASKGNSEAVKSFKTFKKQIFEKLDKLDTELKSQVEVIDKENAEKLQNAYLKCEAVRKESDSSLTSITSLFSQHQKYMLPERIKSVKPRLPGLQTSLNEAMADKSIKQCEFIPNMQTLGQSEKIEFLGKLQPININVVVQPLAGRNSVKRNSEYGLYVELSNVPEKEPAKQNELARPPLPRRDPDARSVKSSFRSENKYSDLPRNRRDNEGSGGTINSIVSMPEDMISGGSFQSTCSRINDVATHLLDIKVKVKGDKSACISGSVVLDMNSLVVTDYSNKKVKLINTQKCIVECFHKLDKGPWDIAYVRDTTVAVTIPGEKKVFIFTCKEDFRGNRVLNKDGAISVKGYCRGIIFNTSRNSLIVSFAPYKQLGGPTKIEMIDLNGNVTQTISMGKASDPTFANPVYITGTSDQERIYVSDMSKENVSCLRLDGMKEGIYVDPKLKEPYRIAPGPSGSIYVCGIKSNNIHKISKSCRKMGIVLDEDDGIKAPLSICYCVGTNKLFVGTQDSDDLKVYQLGASTSF